MAAQLTVTKRSFLRLPEKWMAAPPAPCRCRFPRDRDADVDTCSFLISSYTRCIERLFPTMPK
jgi:hypothetical protein